MERLERQEGIVSVWQLRADGLTRSAIRHRTASMRRVHDGVFVEGRAPLTDRQRWWAAVCTAPGTVLGLASAGALWNVFDHRGGFEVVIRPGSSGPKLMGDLLVCRSTCLAADVVEVGGLPVTSPARTILDLMAYAGPTVAGRMMREGLRRRVVDETALRIVAARHGGRRAVRPFRALVDEYATLPIARTRSDAEALALVILQAAGVPRPAVNVRRAGEEADLSWEDRRLIVELDGPDFHRFPTEDARKETRWRAAGWTVRRLSTDDVYDRPERLLAAVRTPNGQMWSL